MTADKYIGWTSVFQSHKMYSFVPRAKMNGKVGFHALFPLWFIVNNYEWGTTFMVVLQCCYPLLTVYFLKGHNDL